MTHQCGSCSDAGCTGRCRGARDVRPDLALLLSESLDLSARARRLAECEAELMEWQMRNPHVTKSATVPIWAEEQYQRDLADWEARARKALTNA